MEEIIMKKSTKACTGNSCKPYITPSVEIMTLRQKESLLTGSDETLDIVNNEDWPFDPITNQPVFPW